MIGENGDCWGGILEKNEEGRIERTVVEIGLNRQFTQYRRETIRWVNEVM